MRVAFNAQLLSYRHWYRSAGISRYIDRILGGLARHLDGADCVGFIGPDTPSNVPALGWLRQVRTTLPTERPWARILWEQTVLPVALRRYRIELLHAPAYVAPLAGGARTVVTFHDLSYYLMPEAFSRQNRLYLQTFSRWTARRADRFIAVSEATRQDLIRLLRVAPERVEVVPNGVDERFAPEEDRARLEAFRAKHQLPERFILYLGTLEPRKNLPTLLRAYAEARRRGVTEPLVIAGGQGWGELGLRRMIEELGIEASVSLPGFIPMEEQALWYNAATLFAYPSRYEGFGLPVAEAMACGTPVVTSNRSSLPEVVGDAGVTVDPDDPIALAETLLTILGDSTWRDELRRRGLERRKGFSWERAAALTAKVYRRAIGSPSS